MSQSPRLQAELPPTFEPSPKASAPRRIRFVISLALAVVGTAVVHLVWFRDSGAGMFVGVSAASVGITAGAFVALAGFLGVGRDLLRLRRDHVWLLSSLDQLPLGFNIKSKDGTYLLVNAEFARRYGKTKSEIQGRANETLFPENVESNRRAREQESLLIDRAEAEQRIETKTWSDGTQRSLLINKFPIFGARGDVTAIGSVGFDITEQERARRLEHELTEKSVRESTLLETKAALEAEIARQTQALRDANAALRRRLDLIEALSDHIEHATGPEFMSALVARLSEILPAETVFVGRLTEDREHVQTVSVFKDGAPAAPFHYPLAGSPCRIVLQGKPSVYADGVAELFPDDQPLATNGIRGYVGDALRDHAGNSFGIIVALTKEPIADAEFAARAVRLFSDRTAAELERMDKDAALRALNAELEQRVADRTRDLTDANIKLEQTLNALHTTQGNLVRAEKLAALGGLVAGVAHEINTPLGNALMASTALHDRNAAMEDVIEGGKVRRSDLREFTRTAARACDHIIENLKRVGELVERFKGVATDSSTLERRIFMLNEPVATTLRLMQAQFALPACDVVTEIPAELSLDSFPGAIDQVMIHLLENALAHGIAGRAGGTISITARNPDTGLIRLTVRDNGRGIAAENLEKVFEPFFTTARGRGKVGLGLHIVHNIVVNTLGGTIKVASEPGAFTEFVLEFPMTTPQELEETAA